MSETPVLLTAKQAADLSEAFRLLDIISGSTDGKGLEIYRPALSAIASGQVVCIEAERLAERDAARPRAAESATKILSAEDAETLLWLVDGAHAMLSPKRQKADPLNIPKLQAIADKRVVCIAVNKLDMMKAALAFYAGVGVANLGLDNGQKAREALAAQEVGNG